MNELIVEGLTPGDFLLLQQIITTYNISISSDIDWAHHKYICGLKRASILLGRGVYRLLVRR